MQFTCSAEKLIEGLQISTKALAVRTTNPILEGVLIETNEEGVVLTCSDERITIVTTIEATVKKHGRGVVPGKLFNEFIRRMANEEITITMNERFGFSIRSASSRTNIAGQDADLYPSLPQIDNEREISLPQDMLRDMIQKTEFAIATEDMREVLTGCLLEIVGGDVSMVALDGFRMALKRAKCSDVLEKLSAIIPGRAVGDIGKLLSGHEDAFAQLFFGGNKLHIRLENTEIFVILVEGEYVNYRQILPKQFATRISLELEPFRRCVDRASLIAREGNNNLLLLKISEGTLEIEAHSQIGDVHEEMEVTQEGADLKIAFNVRYLTDIVRYIDAEQIEISLNNAISPCIITPVGDPDYVHLVLPVRTSATAG
ncbi:MAG: DNA polymerase III subunit beta [Christensenellales bacterium]|nr:DNA polymerase III subunit beta [Christensenellales bacterium]